MSQEEGRSGASSQSVEPISNTHTDDTKLSSESTDDSLASRVDDEIQAEDQKDPNEEKTVDITEDNKARTDGVGADKSEQDTGGTDKNKDQGSSEGDKSAAKDETEEDSEDEGIDGSEVLDKAARDALYERGLQYETKQKPKLALKCFLQCLKGLSGGAEFSFLPQCLRKVADLYFQQDELEKAIQFIQAEKMYYETALIDTSELQKKVEDRQKTQDTNPEAASDPNFTNPDTVRADEFENLARLCLEKNEAQLALEYQGKATKLRQKIYGDGHAVTRKSLDFFTVIYGEVGKQQYSESMQKLTKATEEGDSKAETLESTEGESKGGNPSGSPPGSPQSILRKRKAEKRDLLKKRVSFNEPEQAREQREQEEWISKALLWVLLFLCLLVLIVIFHYLYCKVDPRSSYCATLRSDLFYYYMRLKYMVYYYSKPAEDDVEMG